MAARCRLCAIEILVYDQIIRKSHETFDKFKKQLCSPLTGIGHFLAFNFWRYPVSCISALPSMTHLLVYNFLLFLNHPNAAFMLKMEQVVSSFVLHHVC